MDPIRSSRGKARGHPDLSTNQPGLSGPSGFSQIEISSGLSGLS